MTWASFTGAGRCSFSSLVQDKNNFWDPLGLSAGKDEATFKRRRAVEIKHGRIAMYATIGYIVPEYYKFPGYRASMDGHGLLVADARATAVSLVQNFF